MLIAAAVCPHPPLLIPEATGPCSDPELDRLRAACHQAVDALLAERPDLTAVVGGDPQAARAAEYPPGTPGRLHDFGIPVTIGAGDGPGGLPLSLTIGKWLLAGRETGPAVWWGIAPRTAPAGCLHLGEKLAALAPRVALLVMGDGPARRARAAPGAADAEADRYDDQLAAALAGPGGRASPRALAALDPRHDGPLEIAGRAAWQVLAGAAGNEQGQDPYAAELRYRGAPFEVSYVVASWRRAH